MEEEEEDEEEEEEGGSCWNANEDNSDVVDRGGRGRELFSSSSSCIGIGPLLLTSESLLISSFSL